METLVYKLENDPHYKDVHLNQIIIAMLHVDPTHVSPFLQHASTIILGSKNSQVEIDGIHTTYINSSEKKPSLFVATIPNTSREVDKIKRYS
jgi:hypothetical protein